MPSQNGSLEVIAGCMSSGKSEELIRRLKRAAIAKQKVIVFKPEIDSRGEKLAITSRDGGLFEAVPIECPFDVFGHFQEDCQVVAFDEAQFFHEELIVVIGELINRRVRVLVAGLDTDFSGAPFGSMPQLMAIADSVAKLNAVCVCCGEPAIRTQRLIDGQPAPSDSPRVVVGGDEMYEARCRRCHMVPKVI